MDDKDILRPPNLALEGLTRDPHGVESAMTIKEAAQQLGVKRKWIQNRVDRGVLGTILRDGKRLIPSGEVKKLKAMLESGEISIRKSPTKLPANAPGKAPATSPAPKKTPVRAATPTVPVPPNPEPNPEGMIRAEPGMLAEFMNMYAELARNLAGLGLRINVTAF